MTRNVNKNRLRVMGCDLVYRIPDTVQTEENTLFCAIPVNPAYWMGTRVASVASTYSSYRPLRIQFHYVPQVAVTVPGTVVMGTLWCMGSPAIALQQTLLTSNGGDMCQCYVPTDTVVDCKTALSQNNYFMGGEFGKDTNPFVFVATQLGTKVVPGYFFISYEYEFWNPVGASWTYKAIGRTSLSDVSLAGEVSAVLAEADAVSGLGPGSTVTRRPAIASAAAAAVASLGYTATRAARQDQGASYYAGASDDTWYYQGHPIKIGNPAVFAFASGQTSVYGDNLEPAATSQYDKFVISSDSSGNYLGNVPVITRPPDTPVTVNEGGFWADVKARAGTFIKSVLIPAGKSALTTIMNPDTMKAVQFAFNQEDISGASSSLTFGYNRLNFASLAETVKSKLSSLLGVDITQATRLLVSNQFIPKAITTSRAGVGTLGNTDFNGYVQPTEVDSENVISSTLADFQSSSGTWSYIDADGNPRTIEAIAAAPVYRFASGQTSAGGVQAANNPAFDMGYVLQESFLQPYEYEGSLPPITAKLTADEYQAIVDDLVATGVNSVSGAVVVPATLLGDKQSLSTSVQTVTNNYAANSQTVNNRFSIVDLADEVGGDLSGFSARAIARALAQASARSLAEDPWRKENLRTIG